jgi:hypothetical protein
MKYPVVDRTGPPIRDAHNAKIHWKGKPNPFPPDTLPWKRTEAVKEAHGKTVAKFCFEARSLRIFAKRRPEATVRVLHKRGLIEFVGVGPYGESRLA